MADKPDEFDGLEDVFAAARAEAPAPSAALTARILADADAAQPRPAPAAPGRGMAPGGGFWRMFIPALGGPGVLAGLAGAMVAGAWLGFAQPAPIAGLAEQVTGQVTGQVATLDQVDLLPAIDSYLAADAGE